jgi:uncharacterized protein (TIGR02145 family)
MNAKFKWFILNLCLLFPLILYSQGEFNNWYFDNLAGLTYNSGYPVPLTNSGMLGGGIDITVSDSLGNLLFLSNSQVVLNRNQHVMPNGILFGTGCICGSQQIISVQRIDDFQRYYLFYVNTWTSSYPAYGLRYSILNMNLDGGLGDIEHTSKNISIPGMSRAWSVVTATRHQNNKNAWVVTRISDPDSNYFASFLVDQNGLNTTAILSPSLITTTNPPTPVTASEIKISPDGTKLMCIYNADTIVAEFCHFDRSTGEVTPLFKFKPSQYNSHPTICKGIEFSIQGKYLYVSTKCKDTIPAPLYQYDATKTDSAQFMQSETLIATGTGLFQSEMQMGPDGKIYITHFQVDSLHVINHPSIQGTGCDFHFDTVSLAGRQCNGGFDQFIQRYYVLIHSLNLTCSHSPVAFTSSIWPQPDSIQWDFGDPSSGVLNYSTFANPSHIYTNSGTYTVELYVRHIDNRTDTAWQVITILPGPQVDLGPDRTICLGDSVTFDAGACSGCTYDWKDLSTGLTVATTQTFKTGLAGTYTVAVTSPNTCMGRDTVQLVTTAVPVLGNNPLNKTICTGESTNILLSSSPPGAVFHWTATLTLGTVTGFSADSGLVINQVLTNSFSTPGIVTYHITPKIGSCSGSTVNFPVTVNPGDSVKVSISASLNNICSGTSVTFTATPTYGGSSPSYQWKVNGVNAGTNSSVFTYTPLNNDVVSCILTSSNTVCVFNNPATSNAITMIVNPQMPVSVSITSSLNPVCAGNTVLFTAHPVNEGSTPVYQWKVNGVNTGTNSSTFTYIPVNNDQVSCLMTSSLTVCVTNNPATSNTIIMQVDQNHPVSLTISPSLNPVCVGNTVLFTALPVNPGLTPVYQWKVNGVNTGTNSSIFNYIPVNNDQVSCVLTSSLTSCVMNNPAMSNVVTMTVNPNYTVSLTITSPSDTVCQGTSVQFTAHPVNEGLTPFYQWKVNGVNTGGNSSTFYYTPVNADVVSCVLTSSYTECTTNNPATSNSVLMTVFNNLIAGVSISAIPNPFCSGSTVSCSAIPTNGGFTPSYQWKVNGVNAGTNASTYSFVSQQGDIVQCLMNSSLSCITNNPVTSNTIVMNALAAPSVSFTLCFDSITTLNAAAFKLKGGVPIGGVYSGPGVNSVTGVFTPSSAGIGTKTITYFYQNSFSCANSKSKTIIVQAAPSFNCGQNLTDIRDNKVYPTIQLGTQCWMQKNLNYGTSLQGTTEQTDNCINEKYCYNDNASNCTLYGGLYQWDELMAYNSTPGAQGLCPPGWHVPTQSEWNTLFTFYQQQALAGKPLQDTIIMGFRAKESGMIYSNFSWSFKGFATIFWTSTPSGTIKAMSHGMNLINFSVSDYLANRSNAFAVRCLHD